MRATSDRDAILAAVDLEALADELLGRSQARTAHPAWPCPDPAHPKGGRTPTDIAVFATRRGEKRWHCQGCGSNGTAIDLVMSHHRLTFRQALDFLRRWTPRQHAAPPPTSGASTVHDVVPRTRLDAWVARAEALLWQDYGAPVRTWLTETRGIPDDVLRTNRVGATGVTPDHVLPTRRAVDGHRGATPAAVLPVLARGEAIHAQLRLVTPAPGQPAYLNPMPTVGGHPHLALLRPAARRHPEIIVTKGIIDGLSANAAGYRAAALLAPGHAGAEVVLQLSRLNGPLVMGLPPDGPAHEAGDRLTKHLAAHGRPAPRLDALPGDLNDALVASHDWPRKLTAHVRQATAPSPSPPTLGRTR